MRCHPLLLLFLALLAPLPLAAGEPAPTMPLGVTVLFAQTSDSQKWSGDPNYWTFEDDVITGTNSCDAPLSAHTYLIFKGDGQEPTTFDNFELTAQFKIEGDGGNSGIQYRGEVFDFEPFRVAGYQADIDFDKKYAGIIYEQNGRGILAMRGETVTLNERGQKSVERFADAEKVGNGIHSGQWNDYRIVADERTLEHYINEAMTSRLIDLQVGRGADSGVIALQLHKGPPMTVEFKNIVIRPFK